MLPSTIKMNGLAPCRLFMVSAGLAPRSHRHDYRCTSVQHRSDKQEQLGACWETSCHSWKWPLSEEMGKLSRGFVGCWDGFRLSRSCREGHTPTHPHLSSSANLHPFPPPSHTAWTLSLHQCVCCAQVNVFAHIHNLESGKEASLTAEWSITCKEHLGEYTVRYMLFFWWVDLALQHVKLHTERALFKTCD